MRYITALILLVVLKAGAQSVTENDLLGKWQIASMEASGMNVDYDKKEVKLTGEMAGLISEEDLENMKADLFSKMEAKSFYGLEYTKGSMVSFVDGDNRKESPYTLQQKGGKYFMEGGPIPGAAEISIAGDKLTLSYETGPMVMTFKKVK